MYTWFDGTAGVEVGQWYLTPGAKGVKLDVGQYDDGNTKPKRTNNTKYYLYYNGDVMAFTTDISKADDFIFVDEAAYRAGLADYYTNGGVPQGSASIDLPEANIDSFSKRGHRDGVYNIAGQRVRSDYKGIAIVNGRKILKCFDRLKAESN
jgi:hypothetical protein